MNTGLVKSVKCSCPAAMSGYCTHVMALFLEHADYTLRMCKSIPEEIASTSKVGKCGISIINIRQKEPIMQTDIQKKHSSEGITSTLYDSVLNYSRKTFDNKIETLKTTLLKNDKRIEFAHVGDFHVGPPCKKMMFFDSYIFLLSAESVFDSEMETIKQVKHGMKHVNIEILQATRMQILNVKRTLKL